MWKFVLIGLALVFAFFAVRYAGWIRYAIQQRRREERFPTSAPRHYPQPRQWRDDQLTIAWLGHATLLINFYGVRIITDPVFSDAVGIRLLGLFHFGARRIVPCALAADQLPPIDLVLQSHAHLDHLDVRSWKQLPRKVTAVMAPETSQHIRHLGFASVTELHWGETAQAAGVRVTAVEVRHWGERFPWSRWHGYNAYLLERNGKTILFGGDTAYTNTLRKACEGRKIDVAILPIGGYQPWIQSHASPEQAWKMFREIRADFLIPIHHQTFLLSHEPPGEPLQRLLKTAAAESNRIGLREIGETFVFPSGN